MTTFEQFLKRALAASGTTTNCIEEDDHNDPQQIRMNVPFLMRVLELVHERVTNDKQLHVLVEAIQEQMKDLDSDEVLTMDNYDEVEQSIEELGDEPDEQEQEDEPSESEEPEEERPEGEQEEPAESEEQPADEQVNHEGEQEECAECADSEAK